ncbi:MAG: small basic protein [Planctomycetota bacterium]|jgi:small basic protein (TIGR04137 family)
MGLHKSLKSRDAMKRQRSVLTRAERIEILEDEGRWDESKSVFALPKVRQFVMKRRHGKAARKEEEAAAAAAAEEGEGVPAPEAEQA